jgi:3',5'-cyclic AMP phosphodiesterase CpdA
MTTARMKTLAHLSDVHLGRSEADAAALRGLVAALVEARIDHVVVTGDVTHRGRLDELATFRRLVAPIADRLTVVPGNHDRLGEDAARLLMRGRVALERRDGLHLVRLDSTAPHNRRLLDGHGKLSGADVDAVEAAAGQAEPGQLVVLLLHHHVHPLPGDDLWERLSDLVGLPWTAELAAGRDMLGRLRGRCDLVLHGHRHVPAELVVGRGSARPVRVVNAGSSTSLGRVRVFAHAGGQVVGEGWLTAGAGRPTVVPLRTGVDGVPAAA